MNRIYFLEITSKTLGAETQAEFKYIINFIIIYVFNLLDNMGEPEILLEEIKNLTILFIQNLTYNLILNDNIKNKEKGYIYKTIDNCKETIEIQLEDIIEAYLENL